MFELFVWHMLEYHHLATGRYEDIASLQLALEQVGVPSHLKEIV